MQRICVVLLALCGVASLVTGATDDSTQPPSQAPPIRHAESVEATFYQMSESKWQDVEEVFKQKIADDLTVFCEPDPTECYLEETYTFKSGDVVVSETEVLEGYMGRLNVTYHVTYTLMDSTSDAIKRPILRASIDENVSGVNEVVGSPVLFVDHITYSKPPASMANKIIIPIVVVLVLLLAVVTVVLFKRNAQQEKKKQRAQNRLSATA